MEAAELGQGCEEEMWLLRAMDTLWFHQIIDLLSPANSSSKTHPQLPNYFSLHNNTFSQNLPTSSQVGSSSEESDDDDDDHEYNKEMRLNHRRRHHLSSSPTISAKKLSTKLEKTMSLGDLELEEVKGFMDLGFTFKKHNLSRRMVRLIPGLKRLLISSDQDDEVDSEETIMRPYLSEAWLVKRPAAADYSSPLRIAAAGDCSASDMKEKFKVLGSTCCISCSPTIFTTLVNVCFFYA